MADLKNKFQNTFISNKHFASNNTKLKKKRSKKKYLKYLNFYLYNKAR